MKKALEGELISLAHKILQLKGEKDVGELKQIAAKIYEKLSVLEFTEKHFEGPKPTIGRKEIETILEEESRSSTSTEKPVQGGKAKAEQSSTPTPEPEEKSEIKNEPRQEKEAAKEDGPQRPKPHQSEDLGIHYDDLPDFEPVNKTQNQPPAQQKTEEKEPASQKPKKDPVEKNKENNKTEEPTLFSPEKHHRTRNEQERKASLNDQLKKGIQIGLNDRMAYVKHLFDGSSSDYNRVLSQLNTMRSYQEAEEFVVEQVKPDYDWEGEEKYEELFLKTLENRFNK